MTLTDILTCPKEIPFERWEDFLERKAKLYKQIGYQNDRIQECQDKIEIVQESYEKHNNPHDKEILDRTYIVLERHLNKKQKRETELQDLIKEIETRYGAFRNNCRFNDVFTLLC